ncbi:MAG: DNA recombination protein RmuC [Bacteroidales bacterium]|nr:DNA recombination protein RmuC [Bacteroidales bacterium]
MMYIAIGLAVIAIGAMLGWLHTRNQLTRLDEKILANNAEITRRAETESILTKKMEELRSENSQLLTDASSRDKELDMLRTRIEEAKTNQELLQQRIDTINEEKANILASAESMRNELRLLHEQALKDDRQRNEAFERQLQTVREQLKNETRQLLEQRADALGRSNNEQMSGVVNPLKEQLAAMQQQVNESLKTTTENRASIEKAIEMLVKRTEAMASEANNLARALKNESKTQGNWGEMVLDTILQNSGLEKGVHYETQLTIRDEQGHAISNDDTGRRMIPDVIVHYPDDKDIIIDSKTSLTSYLDYCNANSDEERLQAAKQHLISLRRHVQELKTKNYAAYIKPPHQSLHYMIMFVPNEGALQLALQEDSSLWHEAFESGICITSEQNLIVLLRMIKIAWTQVQQFQNQKEIMAQAQTLLDRVLRFTERFEKVSAGIDRIRKDYDDAKLAFDGRQGILGAAKAMERLGAKSSQQRLLPDPVDE